MKDDKKKYTLILHDHRNGVTLIDDIWLTEKEYNNQDSIPYYIHICYLEEEFDMDYFDEYITYIITGEIKYFREQ